MPRRFSCVCGYQWCAARDVCSWAWTRVDATEGAYHVKAGTTGTDQYEEYRQFTRAREVRGRLTHWEAVYERNGNPNPAEAQRLIQEYWAVPPQPEVSVQNMSGYHVSRLSGRTMHSFTPPTVPQWQIDVFRQWLENSDDILDAEDPS